MTLSCNGAVGALGGLGSLAAGRLEGAVSKIGRLEAARDSNGRADFRSPTSERPSEDAAKGLASLKSDMFSDEDSGSCGIGIAVRGGKSGPWFQDFWVGVGLAVGEIWSPLVGCRGSVADGGVETGSMSIALPSLLTLSPVPFSTFTKLEGPFSFSSTLG